MAGETQVVSAGSKALVEGRRNSWIGKWKVGNLLQKLTAKRGNSRAIHPNKTKNLFILKLLAVICTYIKMYFVVVIFGGYLEVLAILYQ